MTDPEVLVVGAGPVGLVLACELARRNVALRVVDTLPMPTTESRAILVHARSLEMLERIGVIDEIIASGVKTTAMEIHSDGRTIASLELDSVDSPYPYSITTAQTETERVLTARLAELGVTVERGLELTAFTQDDAGVQYTLRHADGSTSTGTSRWIVGTDGAHSTVRAGMGEKLEGSFKGERFLLGDVEADCSLSRDTMHSYFAADGPLLVFPMLGERLRLIAEIPTAAGNGTGAEDVSLERLQAITDERAGGIRLLSSHWITVFEIHHAQVPSYRVGRAFLAGDAAHVHSPAGGQGMNTGMQDAFNLGWKLAAVVGGTADEGLLDSYQLERHPIAARVIRDTTLMTTAGTLDKRVQQQLRNHLMHCATGLAPVQHLLAAETEETGLNYRGSPIVSGRRHGHVQPGDIAPSVGSLHSVLASDGTGSVALVFGSGSVPAAFDGTRKLRVGLGPSDGFDAVVDDPDGRIAHRYGLAHGGVAIVRPDGYLSFIGDAG